MFRRKDWRLALIFIFTIGLIFVVSAFNYFSFREVNRSVLNVHEEIYPLDGMVRGLQLSVISQETSVRGYVMDGDPAFLIPYAEAGEMTERYVGSLEAHAGRSAAFREEIGAVLDPLLGLRQFFDEEIRLVQTGRIEQAREELARGKALSDNFRSALNRLEQRVSASMNEEWFEQSRASSRSMHWLAAIVVLSLAAVAVTVLLLRTARRAIQGTVESERRYRQLMESLPDAVIVHQDGAIVYANPAAAALVKAEHPGQLLGKPIRDFAHVSLSGILANRARPTADEEVSSLDEQIAAMDGSIVEVEVKAITVPYASRPSVLVMMRDIGMRKQAERQMLEAHSLLTRLSTLDGLTGIANRRTFDEKLAEEWDAALRDKKPFSLVLFDVDEFKKFNDSYGHLSGDSCLQTVATIADAEARAFGAMAFRYGGEEFALLLSGQGRNAAWSLAEAVRRAVEQAGIRHETSSGREIVTISMGMASIVPRKGQKPQELIELADRALYLAKNSGKNLIKEAPAAGRPFPLQG